MLINVKKNIEVSIPELKVEIPERKFKPIRDMKKEANATVVSTKRGFDWKKVAFLTLGAFIALKVLRR